MKKNHLLLSILTLVCLTVATNIFATDTNNMVPIAEHYTGGKDSLLADIQKELVYPPSAKRNRRQGTVQVSVTLMPDGTVTNLRVVKDVGAGCGAEAMRIIKTLKFNAPGYQANYSIPVKFKL